MVATLPSSSGRPRVVVTTSWDDDDQVGMKVADILSSYDLQGTFFVPTYRLGERNRFSENDLRTLSTSGFEIGAHTVNHPVLNGLRPAELCYEVGQCKQHLEDTIGKEVATFCYPRGRANTRVRAAVRDAGYRGARGTLMLSTGTRFSPFEIPTTLQAYPHTRVNYVRNLIRLGAFRTALRSVPTLLSFDNWLQLGKATFDGVLESGGIWHLYGHPWEIQQLDLWNPLKELLHYVSGRSGAEYLTNGALLSLSEDSDETSCKTQKAKVVQ